MGVIKIVTPQKMSLERETFIYIFSIPNMEKSHAFLEVRLGFFLTALMTHTIGFNSTLNLRKISNFQVLSIFLLDNFRGLTATR